jgi:hypothetical protein
MGSFGIALSVKSLSIRGWALSQYCELSFHLSCSPAHDSVDLGSGVGNCVMQVALEAGSRRYILLDIPTEHC